MEVKLPGVKQDDASVECRGGELAVTGKVKERQRVGLYAAVPGASVASSTT